MDFNFAPRPPISCEIVPAGASARARTSLTAKLKPRGGASNSAITLATVFKFSSRSVMVMAFNLGVSVTEADSERWGRMSRAASSTRLYFNRKTRTKTSAAAALPATGGAAAGTTGAVSEMAMKAAKKTLFLTRTKNPETRGLTIVGLSAWLNLSISQSFDLLNIYRAIHDPDHAGLSGPRVQVVDGGIRRILHRPARLLENLRHRRGMDRRNEARLHGFALRRRERGQRCPGRRRSGHEQGQSQDGCGRDESADAAPARRGFEPPFRLLQGEAGADRREDEAGLLGADRGRPRRGENEQGIGKGCCVTAGVAGPQVLAHAAAFLHPESFGRVTFESVPGLPAGERHGFSSPALVVGRWRPGAIFSISRRSTRRALKRWLRTVDSPQFKIAAISLVSRSSISRRTKAAFCFPVSRPETRWKRREARSSSAALDVSFPVSLSRRRTRCSVAVWALSRLRADLKKSIDRLVAIR